MRAGSSMHSQGLALIGVLKFFIANVIKLL